MTAPSLSLHPGQIQVYHQPSRFKVIVAGRRWGKTQFSKISIIKAARIPRQTIWYVAPTYPMANEIMWPELLDSIPPDWIHKTHETRMALYLRNKTRIVCKGADDPQKLRGRGLNYVVLDEYQDMDPVTWPEVIRPMLATTGGKACFIGTPKSFNHLYDAFQRGQDPENRRRGTWYSWQFRTIDSPFVSPEEIEEARQDTDEKTFRQEYEASFETMGGRVYFPFNRQEHTGDLEFNPRLPLWIGQDFNRDPMSSVVLQPQENGEVWVVDEIVLRDSSTEDVVNEIERRYWRYQKNTTIFPDPAANYSQHARGETDLDIFREKGYYSIFFRRKHPKVVDRVNCVNRMFKAADGSVKMRVNRKCKNLIASLEQTIYKEGSRDVDKSQSMEHAADALGYPVEYRFPLRQIKLAGFSL